MKKFFSKYKRSILRAFVELLVIFAGISISLAIDDWRQRRAEQELVMEYMRSMYVDVLEDLKKLGDQTSDRIGKINDCKYILQVMHHPDSLSISGDEFRKKFGWVTRLDKFVCSDNTYKDLTSTGNFKLISDVEIKNHIYSYYRAVGELTELVDINNEASARLTLDIITTNFSVRSVYEFGGGIYEGIEEFQEFDISFFHEPNSEKYLRLEDLILFRTIFLSMEMKKYQDIFFPLLELRDKLCEFTGIPTIDQMVEESKKTKRDFIDLYDEYVINYPQIHFLESELNDHGYLHLREKELDLALQFFLLNAYIFPESADAYDCLGEIYFNLGDYENSKINYKKALVIDPDYESSALGLKEIEEKLK